MPVRKFRSIEEMKKAPLPEFRQGGTAALLEEAPGRGGPKQITATKVKRIVEARHYSARAALSFAKEFSLIAQFKPESDVTIGLTDVSVRKLETRSLSVARDHGCPATS